MSTPHHLAECAKMKTAMSASDRRSPAMNGEVDLRHSCVRVHGLPESIGIEKTLTSCSFSTWLRRLASAVYLYEPYGTGSAA